MDSCCVVGCDKNSENSPENFYPFPKDFDLCMLWVQTCGRAEYFEDFAYGGALPFINRKICSCHFNSTDYIDPDNKLLGLREGVVPIGNFLASDIVIKKEIPEPDSEDSGSFANFHQSLIKEEPCGGNDLLDEDFFDEHDDDSNHSALPILVISKEKISWKKKPPSLLEGSIFRSTWSQALHNVETRAARKRVCTKRRPNESEEDRKRRLDENARRIALKRANESEQDRKDRLYKNAVRAALRRSLETEEQQRERRLKNALRAAYRRSIETPEQKAERRRKDLLRSARRRKEETELQAKIRKYNDAVRAAFRRRNETPEQRQQRKMIDVLRAARRRSMETPEQRQARLKADRERAARRRLLKKISNNIAQLKPQMDSFIPQSLMNINLQNINLNIKAEPGALVNGNADYDSPSFVDVNSMHKTVNSEVGVTSKLKVDEDSVDNIDEDYQKPEFVWCS